MIIICCLPAFKQYSTCEKDNLASAREGISELPRDIKKAYSEVDVELNRLLKNREDILISGT